MKNTKLLFPLCINEERKHAQFYTFNKKLACLETRMSLNYTVNFSSGLSWESLGTHLRPTSNKFIILLTNSNFFEPKYF